MTAMESKEKQVSEWFAECGNNDSNNRLAEALAAQGLGYDSVIKNELVPCHDGVERPMFCIPSAFVQRMKKAKKGSNVLMFRFWKRAHHNVPAYPMDFIEQSGGARRSPNFKSAAAKLRARRQAEQSLPSVDEQPDF